MNLAKINDLWYQNQFYFYTWDQTFEHEYNQKSSVETKKSIIDKYGAGVEALSACKHTNESLNGSQDIQLLLILLSNG